MSKAFTQSIKSIIHGRLLKVRRVDKFALQGDTIMRDLLQQLLLALDVLHRAGIVHRCEAERLHEDSLLIIFQAVWKILWEYHLGLKLS